VVIPQFLGCPAFIKHEALAREHGAEFHEIVLLDSKENTLRRFAARGRLAAEPAHVEALQMLERSGGPDELAAMDERLVALVAARPAARVAGEVDRAYRALIELPGGLPGRPVAACGICG
jgi:hypothetical protein